MKAVRDYVPSETYMSLPIVEKDEGFKLISELYEKTHFVDHQIDTYNDFITRR